MTPLRLPTRLELRLAARYLRGRGRLFGLSLNTVIAAAGVMIGVAALIVVLGVMNGLRDELRDRILVANPDLRILTYGQSLRMDPWRGALDSVLTEPGVVAAAPEVLTQSLARNGAGYMAVVNVVGMADTGSRSVTTLPAAIKEGDLSFRTTHDSVDGGIILGYRLANRMSAFPGDVIELIGYASAQVNRALGQVVPRFWRMEVTGVFETGMFQYDDGFGVLSMAMAQQLDGLGDAVSGIQIKVEDPWQAPAIGRRLEERLGYPYRALDWQTQNAQLFSALQLEKLGMGLIICIIMIVAAFNIVGTLTMVVADKTREIGILRAMGLTGSAIGRVFVIQGAIIGAVGTVLGMGLGLALAYLIDRSGLIRINPSVYFVDRLPVHVELIDVLIVAAVSLAVATVATIHPSRAAARLVPVEAIRHE
ncbi:MAG TPA: FtsX-like permease family protein [Gemmatimonadales bacterium]